MLQKTYTETIETDRLILRRFQRSDCKSAWRNWASLPEVQLNYGEPVYETAEDTMKLLDSYIRRYGNENYYRWAVIEKESGECIGLIAYFLVEAGDEFGEIEYCIGTAFQGRGYATEACRAVIRYGFETIGFHKVQICSRVTNVRSQRVIAKCGFTYEGTLRDYFHMPDGSFEGRMYFSILKDEFR